MSNPVANLSAYELNHLLKHLSECGQGATVHRLLALETAEGRNAWYDRRTQSGTDADYQRDIDVAADLASQPAPEPAFLLRTRYQLISSSLCAIHDRFPARLIARLVATGVWSIRRALDTTEFLSSQSARYGVIHELMPLIPPDYKARAVEIAYSLAEIGKELVTRPDAYHDLVTASPRAQILGRLSAMFNGSEARDLAQAAIELAERIDEKRDRAAALGGFLPHIPVEQQEIVAEKIAAIADSESNPALTLLLLPVLGQTALQERIILPRIKALTEAAAGYREKQHALHVKDAYAALARGPLAVRREAFGIAAAFASKGKGHGLLACLAESLDLEYIREAERGRARKPGKFEEAEWLPLFVRLAESETGEQISLRFSSLRYPESRIAYYIAIRNRLSEDLDIELARESLAQLTAISATDERVRLMASLARTGRLAAEERARLYTAALHDALGVRNAVPRLAALWHVIDLNPADERAAEAALATIPLLPGKPDRADALIGLAVRAKQGSISLRTDPWEAALHMTRSISRQEDRADLLVRLVSIKPESLLTTLQQDLLQLEGFLRVRTLSRAIPSLDSAQRRETMRQIIETVRRTTDEETQSRMLSTSAAFLDEAALTELAQMFRPLADHGAQLACLARIASCDPTPLVPKVLDFLLRIPKRDREVTDSLKMLAAALSPEQARTLNGLLKTAASPQTQCDGFAMLGPHLCERDHSAALMTALKIKQRNLRLVALANVASAASVDVLDRHEGQIVALLPPKGNAWDDPDADTLCLALSTRIAQAVDMGKALQYVSRSHHQLEHLIGIARFIAADDESFAQTMERSHSVFDLDGRARLQLALLVWRAQLVSPDDAFSILETLDSHCLPRVLTGLSFWLDEHQLAQLLASVAAVRDPGYHAPPPVEHVWNDNEHTSISTYSMASTGYFARTPSGPPDGGAVVAALLPQLVRLGHEQQALELLHQAVNFSLAGPIAAMAPALSEAGLAAIVNHALAIKSREGWMRAVTALAIEFAKRGRWAEAAPLIGALPLWVSETPDFHRVSQVGASLRAPGASPKMGQHIFPTEIADEMIPREMANHPRLGAAVACLRHGSPDTVGDIVDEIRSLIPRPRSESVKAAALAQCIGRAAVLAPDTLEQLAEFLLGIRRSGGMTARRPRAGVLSGIEKLAPAFEHIAGTGSLPALYDTVEKVSRWWA